LSNLTKLEAKLFLLLKWKHGKSKAKFVILATMLQKQSRLAHPLILVQKRGVSQKNLGNQGSQVIWVFTKRPLRLGFMGIYVKFYEVYGKVKRKQKLTASEMAPMIGGIVFNLVILGAFWEYFVQYGYFHNCQNFGSIVLTNKWQTSTD